MLANRRSLDNALQLAHRRRETGDGVAYSGKEPSALASWENALADVFGAVGRVAGHPNFPQAARALARNMLDLSASDPALDAIFKDAGRYVAAMWSFALHQDGGLTLPRLKAMGAASGLLSPGRSRTQLQFLEHLGYIAPSGVGPNGATVYAPTQAFEAAWDRHFEAALAAVQPIAADIAVLLGPQGAAARQTYGRLSAAGYLISMQREQPVPAFLRVFMHHFAGSHVLWTLLASDADPAFPPGRAGPVSIKGLAQVAGVARIQVARIFKAAKAEGLADLNPDGYVHFRPAAREEMAVFYAIQLAQALSAGATAARQHGLIGKP